MQIEEVNNMSTTLKPFVTLTDITIRSISIVLDVVSDCFKLLLH